MGLRNRTGRPSADKQFCVMPLRYRLTAKRILEAHEQDSLSQNSNSRFRTNPHPRVRRKPLTQAQLQAQFKIPRTPQNKDSELSNFNEFLLHVNEVSKEDFGILGKGNDGLRFVLSANTVWRFTLETIEECDEVAGSGCELALTNTIDSRLRRNNEDASERKRSGVVGLWRDRSTRKTSQTTTTTQVSRMDEFSCVSLQHNLFTPKGDERMQKDACALRRSHNVRRSRRIRRREEAVNASESAADAVLGLAMSQVVTEKTSLCRGSGDSLWRRVSLRLRH